MKVKGYSCILMVGFLVLFPFGCTPVTSEIIGRKDCKSVCERQFKWCFDRCQRGALSYGYRLSCGEKCNNTFESCEQKCPADKIPGSTRTETR